MPDCEFASKAAVSPVACFVRLFEPTVRSQRCTDFVPVLQEAVAAAAVADGDQDMAVADAAAPLTFTDVQRDAAAKQRSYEASTAGPSGRGADTAGMPYSRLLFEAAAWNRHALAALQKLQSLAQGTAALRCAVAVAVVDNSIPVSVLCSLAGVHERIDRAACLSGTRVQSVQGRLAVARTCKHLAHMRHTGSA